MSPNLTRAPGAAGGPEMAYAHTYYPGVSDIEHATAVEAQEGQETRVDIQLRKVPVFHLRGKIDGESPSNGFAAPIMGLRISATPLGVLEESDPRAALTVAPDGSFDIPGLTPGAWTITVRSLFGTQFVAHATVTIPNRDVNNLAWPRKRAAM